MFSPCRHDHLYAALRERASIEGMVNKHMTVADIAAAVGCSEKSVRTALLPRGLKTMSGRRTTGVGLAAEMMEGVKVPK